MAPFSIHFDFNLRRDHQKISFERRDYESVDEKSLSYAMSRKTMKKKYFQKAICGAYVFIDIITEHNYVLPMQLLYVKLTLYKKELFSKRGDVPTLIL